MNEPANILIVEDGAIVEYGPQRELATAPDSRYGALLRTGIERIGNSSFVVTQQAWQNGKLVARGKAVQVYFEHDKQASAPIPERFRAELERNLGALPE